MDTDYDTLLGKELGLEMYLWTKTRNAAATYMADAIKARGYSARVAEVAVATYDALKDKATHGGPPTRHPATWY